MALDWCFNPLFVKQPHWYSPVESLWTAWSVHLGISRAHAFYVFVCISGGFAVDKTLLDLQHDSILQLIYRSFKTLWLTLWLEFKFLSSCGVALAFQSAISSVNLMSTLQDTLPHRTAGSQDNLLRGKFETCTGEVLGLNCCVLWHLRSWTF